MKFDRSLRQFTQLSCFLLLLCGCGGTPELIGDDDGFGGASGGSGGATGGSGGTSPQVTLPDGGDEPEPEATCGNALLEPGELCDDGNAKNGDGCSADCAEQDPDYDCSEPGEPCVKTVVCGNDRLEGDEVCDDGNTEDGDGCSSNCRAVTPGWACTRPGVACVELPLCGNGTRERGEDCDDGQQPPADGDGCDATCGLEDGFFCGSPGQACLALKCGDGVRTPDEACDDAQDPPLNGDGCSTNCEVEPGFRCGTSGCAAICGDGLARGVEQCDDGGRNNGDGCSAACSIEPFFDCNSAEPSVCGSSVQCGNSVVEPGEICDPPGSDGCNAGCRSFSPSGSESVCGNGVMEAGESCEPPGMTGCNAGCAVEPGYTCPRPNVCLPIPRCGDGLVHAALGETCDDGNASSGDGCSSCKVDGGWFCTGLGPSLCVLEACGDGLRTPGEECDDGNAEIDDGCSGCVVDAGWSCPFSGQECFARCGDGLLVGDEECDDANTTNGDGCNAGCLVEFGFTCPSEGEACVAAICGNGAQEEGEGCDDGNTIAGDGCGPTCQWEPTVTVGPNPVVNVFCGDGLITGDEECDDGNANDGDGCDAACDVEPEFTCEDVVSYPSAVQLKVTYRDLKARSSSGGHPDFQWQPSPFRLDIPGPVCTATRTAACNSAAGSVCPANTCGRLDNSGKPVYHLTNNEGRITSAATYGLWYRNTNAGNVTGQNGVIQLQNVVSSLTLNQIGGTGSDVYRYDSSAHFPLNGTGFGNTCSEISDSCCNQGGVCRGRNYHFTTELRYFFQFRGGETLSFRGDDDVWVFVNGRHAVDIGGVHGALWGRVVLGDDGDGGGNDSDCSVHGAGSQPGACTLQAGEISSDDDKRFGLVKGGVYEIVLFHAERHTTASNFQLTLAGFLAPRSVCTPICGDGEVVEGEVCDDGADNQDDVSGSCNETCTAIAYCGDGVQQAGEDCDNGTNLDLYLLESTTDACAPGCVLPPTCGDGSLQAAFEECDNGAGNDDASYGDSSCTTACTFGGYCGDGVPHTLHGEACDKGAENGVGYGADSCGYDCLPGPRCGDDVRNGPEECDGTPNCNSACQLEPFCGDGVQSSGEACDYAQFASNAYGGCTATCEWGPSCGDGEPDSPYEQCDLGAGNDDDVYNGCTTYCTDGPHCGDGLLQSSEGEACDNGFNDDTYAYAPDACGLACKPVPYCGDGKLQPAFELCDRGAQNHDLTYNGCTTDCEWGPYCGDGELAPQEQCDDGLDNRGYSPTPGACGYDCAPAPYCGDGQRNGPEQCDLGTAENTGAYGGCKANCSLAPRCGDRLVQTNHREECDDGPTGSLDCTSKCKRRDDVR